MKKQQTENFKAVLSIGSKEIDYMEFESENIITATNYAEERFQKAYPEESNNKDAKLHIEKI